MIERNSSPSIEAEIAELEERIAEKRRTLETENHMVPTKDLVRQVVSDFQTAPHRVPTTTTSFEEASYLDNLPAPVDNQVSYLVERVFEKGLAHTIAEAKKLSPLEQDAFHDTLVEKIYDELKTRGSIA